MAQDKDKPTKVVTITLEELRIYRQLIKNQSAAIMSLTATMEMPSAAREKAFGPMGIAQAQIAMASVCAGFADGFVKKSIERYGE